MEPTRPTLTRSSCNSPPDAASGNTFSAFHPDARYSPDRPFTI
ncbi:MULTISPECIES: hypothetical protein [unclassified Micromonospora]|nr:MULTISPECIES: hypothetical protein [unclassified Micromonospora]